MSCESTATEPVWHTNFRDCPDPELDADIRAGYCARILELEMKEAQTFEEQTWRDFG